MPDKRFTLDGSPELEAQLARMCEHVLSGVRRIIPNGRLEALLLGGGYGRGEGGVRRTIEGDFPYNDLEFYVCLKGIPWLNQRRFRRAFHHLAEDAGKQAGLEVELKLVSLDQLRQSPVTMFYYDLVMGHRVCHGPEEFLAPCAHHRQADRIPLSEATRLVMNRCSGLLFAAERLTRENFGATDADFVGRNHAKAQLGLGDAILAAHGMYHWSCRERHRRLAGFSPPEPIPGFHDIQRHHGFGVAFKLCPQHAVMRPEGFRKQQEELVALGLPLWLWIEEKRLGTAFRNAREYALNPVNKCPETSAVRNGLINARTFGPGALLPPKSGRYPRERLFNALALLLWDAGVFNDPLLLRRVQRELRTRSETLPGLLSKYKSLWSQFG